MYLNVAPAEVDLETGFSWDVSRLGHNGTGDLEVQISSDRDIERVGALFRLAYAMA
ncbi:hypothetical protein ACFWSF_31840 [Streptomyces sp. NPDC058611]|uniref:hypothetical protein n=1 Tax=unclassified Streptomyces TaxID=2593676 RepID=UPI00365DDE84